MLPKNAMPSAPPSSAHLGDAGGGARPLRRRGADDDVVGQREERRSEERQHERRDREQSEPAHAGADGGEQEIPLRPFCPHPLSPSPFGTGGTNGQFRFACFRSTARDSVCFERQLW